MTPCLPVFALLNAADKLTVSIGFRGQAQCLPVQKGDRVRCQASSISVCSPVLDPFMVMTADGYLEIRRRHGELGECVRPFPEHICFDVAW
jgi:hypothetical protein